MIDSCIIVYNSTYLGMMHFFTFSGCTQYGAARWSDRTRRVLQSVSILLAPFLILAVLAFYPFISAYGVYILTKERYMQLARLPKWPRIIHTACTSFCLAISVPIVCSIAVDLDAYLTASLR